jgi:CRP-like cAMP-binding protein
MFTAHSPQQNILLAALPVAAQERLAPHLKLVDMPRGKVLYEAGDKRYHAYFPTESIICTLYATQSGAYAETSMVGNEGMIGVALFMGGESTPGRAIVQRAGHAFQLPRQALMAEFNRREEAQKMLLRYTQSLITQIAQTAACNRHHSINQQLCRWLLLCLDRVPDNRLIMTQELIANMLGVRREGVTEAAGKLQRKGVIKYHRGEISVLDRPGLENLSCECYGVVKGETDRLLPHGCRPTVGQPRSLPLGSQPGRPGAMRQTKGLRSLRLQP